jgi:hypothetical protein
VQEVVDRGALAEELGVGHDRDVVTFEQLGGALGGADGHGRLVDDDGTGGQQLRDLLQYRLDHREVRHTADPHRRRHAQEHDLAALDRRGGAEHERQAAGGEATGHEVGEAGLEDVHLTVGEALHLLRVDVRAHHVVPE